VDGPGCRDCQRPYEDARGTFCDTAEVERHT
jgi:hypothetical protein